MQRFLQCVSLMYMFVVTIKRAEMLHEIENSDLEGDMPLHRPDFREMVLNYL